MEALRTYEELIAQNEELESRLNEAHEIIDAIRTGEIDAFIVKNNDVHELYTLKSADQTYRIFIEKMAEGAVTINRDGIVLYCNSSFANMVNLPLEKVLGFSFIDFIPPEFKNTIDDIIKTAWDKEIKTEITLPGKNKYIPVLLSLTTLEIDGGLALSIIVTNLSFQKEAQEQLKQKNSELEQAHIVTKNLNEQLEQTVQERTNELFKSREHFKFLADNIPAIVWTAGAGGVLDYYNNRWFEYTGSDTIISRNFKSFIHTDDTDAYGQSWKNSITSGASFEMQHRLKKTNNEYRWHLSQAMPYKNNKGEIVAWFGISTDIDDQKKELEKKDEFITIASHELKTPVTSIKGYVQLLQFNFNKEGNTEAAELLNKVNMQVNKLISLINDLLDVKKIENGQLQYHTEIFDFNELVKETIEETRSALNKHTLTCDLSDTSSIHGDRNKIGQVIINFIENASKYSPPGSVINIETFTKDQAVRLAVKDSGIGIPGDQQHKIFERFYRVNGNKENTYSGLGLGLYISTEIIKRHKGIIGVESEKDKGATFYFEIPVY